MDYSPLDSPESIPTIFAEAWNNRDPDHLASLFDKDAEFVNVTGLWWHNRESIRKAHRYGLAHIFQHSTLMVRAVRVKELSDDIAVVHARMRLEAQTPLSGVSAPQPRHTIFSFVVHRTPDGWRCASAHNTDVVPGMETNIVNDDGRFRSSTIATRTSRRGSKGARPDAPLNLSPRRALVVSIPRQSRGLYDFGPLKAACWGR